ncbi:LysR family transcriptional regulator [Nitrincola sp. MINF-07-Sa-05]|uniref:LysR family transcriptional regulator n=1 Tax=Nitrincola salilacus TaxID=3400273 RepID=UPI003917C137
MSKVHDVQLRQLDLNLLVILDALLDERHITRAAERLEMSQPAVSRALARLREVLQDPILVRTSEGLSMSARAAGMQPQLADLLRGISQLVSPSEFDPTTDSRLIKMTGLDLELALYLPALAKRLRRLAPLMRLETVRQEMDNFTMLEQDEVHFSLTGLEPMRAADQLHRLSIDTMPSICLMADDNPLAHGEMSTQAYAAAPHGLVSITGKGPGYMDVILQKKGYQRTIMLRLSSFMSVADFCEDSDLIFTLPLRLAGRIAAGRRLALRPLPTDIQQPPITFYLYWHARYHRDPGMQWVREQLLSALKETGAVTY